MRLINAIIRNARYALSDEGFKQGINTFETLIAKVLALGMILVVMVSVWDLWQLLLEDVLLDPNRFLKTTLLKIFGFFLTILIALELLQNITAYLRQHSVQLELVLVTSLTAVARKIILLDLEKVTGTQLIGLAIAVLTLAVSYGIVRGKRPG